MLIDPTSGQWYKGVPQESAEQALDDLVEHHYCLLDDDLMLPAAVLKASALACNERWMRAFLGTHRLSFAPHAKTTMSPELIQRQIAHGAWAITAATAHHVRAYAAFGVTRIIMANQLVGRANIAAVLDLLAQTPNLEFFCLVDSCEGVMMLADALRGCSAPARVNVLLEIGASGQRCGVRSTDEALTVAAACGLNGERIALRGVEVFEGVYADAADATLLLARLGETLERLIAADAFASGEIIVTAGGTAFFDLATRAMLEAATSGRERLVLRSGCYITHDSHHYEYAMQTAVARNPALSQLGKPEAALEVWAHVQSRPEPDRIIVALGKRDVGNDIHPPTPLWLATPLLGDRRPVERGFIVDKLYDQHLCMTVPAASKIRIGDMMGFGISHPCTTFDKWRALFVVDDDYKVVGYVRTFF